jgi:hypothetical protein
MPAHSTRSRRVEYAYSSRIFRLVGLIVVCKFPQNTHGRARARAHTHTHTRTHHFINVIRVTVFPAMVVGSGWVCSVSKNLVCSLKEPAAAVARRRKVALSLIPLLPPSWKSLANINLCHWRSRSGKSAPWRKVYPIVIYILSPTGRPTDRPTDRETGKRHEWKKE